MRFRSFNPYALDEERRMVERAKEHREEKARLSHCAFASEDEVRRRTIHANNSARAKKVKITLAGVKP